MAFKWCAIARQRSNVMVIALGFWALAIGYATIYTGIQGFSQGSSSLSANLGITSLTGQSPTSTQATQTGAVSNLAATANAPGTTPGAPLPPNGGGYIY